jgi:hypothetical protein
MPSHMRVPGQAQEWPGTLGMFLLTYPKRLRMKFPSKSFIPMLIILFATSALPEGHVQGVPIQKPVAVKRTRELTITIVNGKGKFTGGENRFCVQFHTRATQEPVSVSNVSAEFRQLVGRIVERPIEAALIEAHRGEYCGQADLGKLYYDPSSYYLFVHYVDNGRKNSQRVFVTAISRDRM